MKRADKSDDRKNLFRSCRIVLHRYHLWRPLSTRTGESFHEARRTTRIGLAKGEQATVIGAMVKGTLNPVDKARREARKKELKKNKKQRQQVRSAVIEGRDPEQVIANLEKLDQQEFNVANQTSDTFFKDKRKRLRESWDRILAHYQKEDSERHSNLKKQWAEYEAKHEKVKRDFGAIKAAQEVTIEEVFLPPEQDQAEIDEIADDDPLMSESIYITHLIEGIRPPGCPPGFPPNLTELVDCIRNSLTMPNLAQLVPQNILDLPKKSNRAIKGGPASSAQATTRGWREKSSTNSKAVGETNPKEVAQRASAVVSKAAVIESKPVIFMPKATKFVPASVRSKVRRK